jgi:transposase
LASIWDKNTFHLIAHDYSGSEIFRKKLNRQKLLQLLSVHEPVIVAMEACGGAHWLARRCESYGHQVKLVPAQYVKHYVKTNKNDFIDADAIAEAAMRPNMRFVSPKSELAQVCTVVRKIRTGYIKERTACMNGIGPITASCCLSAIGNPNDFVNGRNFAAWVGLTPRQYSTG